MSDDVPRGNPGVDPDDLDISDSEYVRELGEDRYVVSAGSRPPRSPPEGAGEGDGPERIPDVPEAARQADRATDPAGPTPPEPAPDPESSPARDAVPSRDADPAASGGASGASAGPTAGSSAGSADGLPDDPTRAGNPATGSRSPSEGRSSPDERPASHERRGAPRDAGDGSGGEAPPPELDAGAVGRWLAASLADSEFAYGFDATLALDGRTARHRMASDDVGETFETFVTWFADAAAGDTPTADALGILLAGMDTGPRLPPNAVRAALADLGVSRDDSVAELVAAVERADGLRL